MSTTRHQTGSASAGPSAPSAEFLQLFDPRGVYEAHVHGRRLISLDTSAWAALADARDEVAKRCKSRCIEAAERGAALFPLNLASISELLAHPARDSRCAQAELMDQMSRGVTFRGHRQVYDVESFTVASLIVGGQEPPPQRQFLFTYILEYLGDAQTIFPAGWRTKDKHKFVVYLRAHEAARSLAWWVEHESMVKEMRDHQAAAKARYVKQMTAQLESNRAYFSNADGSLNRRRALREEYAAVWKSVLVPRLSKLPLMGFSQGKDGESVRALLQGEGIGPERRLETFISLMPSLRIFCEVMAARTMNPTRRVRGQDFWDAEHATASAHVDAFVTLDRGLFDLVTNRCAGPKERGCRVYSDLEQLTTYVTSLGADARGG